jgi:hypothetical protein
MSDLYWQTLVYASGTVFQTMESYDSIHARLHDESQMKEASGGVYMRPLELTVRDHKTGTPLRTMFNPMAVAAVLELADHDQAPVVEQPTDDR